MSHDNWSWFFSEAGDPAWNMALDEALLESMPRLNRAMLRFYGWSRPAASFGYFQKYAEIERLTPLRPLVRRPTGGGLVPHDADWTYSLAFPTSHAWYEFAAIESYRSVHEWIAAALNRIGVPALVAPTALKSLPGQCFVGWERFDVLSRGRKIAGAAQRRTRAGLLIQGSVQPPPGLQRSPWEEAMRQVARDQMAVEWVKFEPDTALAERARRLQDEKYSLPGYNRKR